MHYLFIAEKPSLMREVQSCYQKHKNEIVPKVGEIDFTALSGHVCGNFEPKDYPQWQKPWYQLPYPMVPDVWKVKIINSDYKKKTVSEIKKMVPLYDGIIVGTDSDTEGYGIYSLLEKYLHLERKPALRFIEHSLTEEEILRSLLTMTDYHADKRHQNFVNSFRLRSYADWLYGMNATCMMTVKTGELMTIGRVQSPTIKLVY